MLKPLIATYSDALEGAREDLRRGGFGWERRQLQAALIVLGVEGSIEPLEQLAKLPQQDVGQLEVARLGAQVLLGGEARWDPGKLLAMGLREEELVTVRLAMALVEGSEPAVLNAASIQRKQQPGVGRPGAMLEALRMVNCDVTAGDARILRLDLAHQVSSWLPAHETIVAVAFALRASSRNPERVQALLAGSIQDLSDALKGSTTPMAIRAKTSHDEYSAKRDFLVYFDQREADSPSDCSYWITEYGFTRLSQLIQEVLLGDLVMKKLKGDRTTKKKLLAALADPDFSLGIRIPNAEGVLTPAARVAVEERLAAMESWFHVAYEGQIKAKFRFFDE